MSDPLLKTFDHLVASANAFALPVLLQALAVADENIRDQAVTALLRRGQKRGFVELILAYDKLSDALRERIDKSARRLRDALREAVEKGKPNVRQNAIRIIENAAAWPHAEALLKLVVEDGELARPAMQAVGVIVDRLFDDLSNRGAACGLAGEPNHTRHQILASLATAAGRAGESPYLRDVVACICILGEAGDAAVRGLLADANSPLGRAAWELLAESRHPGVMELVASLLTNRIAADRLIGIVERRDDPEFVLHLLRYLPDRFSDLLRSNLGRVSNLPWIDPANLRFDWVPPGLQGRLVEFVSATGIPWDDIFAVQQWVVRNSGVAGRMAAVEALAVTHHDVMETAIADGLSSDDEDVQAWATSQLREQNVPHAYSLLVERLDSPLDAVRAAARKELESFDLDRMLDLFGHLKPDVCRQAGKLLRKIDPDTVQRLESELRSPLRSRRIRAVHGARAMGLHEQVATVLLEMLHDDDHTILRAVIDTLADLPHADVLEELRRLRYDDNPRIRAAADSALRRMEAAM
jgi:HEAT repeats